MFNPGFTGLVHHMLNQRSVDDGEHLLWNRFGGGQKSGAETGNGEDGFANRHG
jgi:hypothetical protein